MNSFKYVNKLSLILIVLICCIIHMCSAFGMWLFSCYVVDPMSTNMLKNLVIGLIICECIIWLGGVFKKLVIYSYNDVLERRLKVSYLRRIVNMKGSALHYAPVSILRDNINTLVKETIYLIQDITTPLSCLLVVCSLYAYFAFKYSLTLGIAFVTVLLAICIYSACMTKVYIKKSSECSEHTRSYTEAITDFYSNIGIINHFDAVDFVSDTLLHKLSILRPNLIGLNFQRFLRLNIIDLALIGIYGATLFTLLQSAEAGSYVVGDLILLTLLFVKIKEHSDYLSHIHIHLSKYHKSNCLVESYLAQADGNRIVHEWKSVGLKLDFTYESSLPNIAYDITLNKGDYVSLTGSSGSGKSTIAYLLGRDVAAPGYYIDGKEVYGQKVDVCYIDQTPEIFKLPLYDNLTMGKQVSKGTILQLIDDMGLTDWYKSLPHGLNTVLSYSDNQLGGGEVQRLCIMRGILADRDVYIIDEPTANCDPTTRKFIYDTIKKYLSDKTVIIISHDAEAKEMCNRHFEIIDRTLKEV